MVNTVVRTTSRLWSQEVAEARAMRGQAQSMLASIAGRSWHATALRIVTRGWAMSRGIAFR